MAQGVTSSITSDVSFTSRLQLTEYDDFLNIIGATVTMAKPQGDVFTGAGNDTVLIEDASIVAETDQLTFLLGSGDDTLTVKNTTLSAQISAGGGNDLIVIDGTQQNKVRLNKAMTFGAGDDILELVSILENAGSIDFGSSGAKTLRFNGGAILPAQITGSTYGTLSSFTALDIAIAGGTTGYDLELVGEQTGITMNGNLLGTNNQKSISVSGGTTTLAVLSNVRTNVRLNLNQMQLIHLDGAILEIADHSGYAVTANDSLVNLHDIVVKGGQGLTGSNTAWTIENSDFSNSTNGIKLTGGTLDFRSGGLANFSEVAMILSGTTLAGSKLSFMNNPKFGAIVTNNADVTITDFRANNNSACSMYSSGGSTVDYYSGGVILQNGGSMTLSSATFSGNFAYCKGGAICQNGGVMTLDGATFSGNYVSRSGYWASSAYIFSACGGAICQSGGYATISGAVFSGNVAIAKASCYGSGYSSSYGLANVSAYGGAVFLDNAIANLENTVFAGNYASASAYGSNYYYANSPNGFASACGGAIYLNKSTLNYFVTSGTKITNVGNFVEARGNKYTLYAGGWLYTKNQATVNISVDGNSLLTIGDSTGNDSIAGDSTCRITKNGTGRMVANSDISQYLGLWTVAEGTLELARLARTIKLDDWTIGTDATLCLSVNNDTINMNMSKKIGTIDLGGGADTINTNHYDLTDGTILLNDLTLGGGGRISVNLRNRSTTEGSILRLNDIYLDSDFTGNNFTDTILINQESTLNGAIDLRGGNNVITAQALSTFKNTLKMGDGNDVLTFTDATFDGTLDFGGGSNTLTTTGDGKFANVAGGNGGNTITVGGDGNFSGEIGMGDGDDSITVNGDAIFSARIGFGGGNDVITLEGAGTFAGEIELGAGVNAIHVNQSLTANNIKITEDGETSIYVYYGSTVTDNTLTVYSDETAARDTITMSWNDQTELDKVRLLVSKDSSFRTYEFNLELYNQSKSFTLNLEQGYFIQFQANDEDGWKQRLLDDNVAPNQVTGLNFNGSVLSWDETHDNLGGNGVKQYHVEVATDASFTNVIASEIVTGTQYAPATLAESTLYFRVNAEDYTNNIGAWSETVTGMFDNTPPSRPTGGKSEVDGYSVTLSWLASTDTGSGVARYEYVITDDNSVVVTEGSTEACSVSAEDLRVGSYSWTVRAVDAAGNAGSWSLTKSFTTVDLVAPGVPTNLDYGVESGTTLVVIWDAASDDALGSGLSGYEIQLAGDEDFSIDVTSVNVTETEAFIEDLATGTFYLRVRAIDNAGNFSGWSETGSFVIDVDSTPPTIDNITASITTPTNQDVVVTATFSDNVSLASSQYRIGPSGTWTNYKNGVIVTENATVYFRAVDASGNETVVPFAVENIDKTPPVKPTASADVTTPTNQNVTVSATFSDDSVVREFSTDGQTWFEYTEPIVFDEVGTVYFRGTDEAENVSEVTGYTVSNIDKIPPVKPTASADVTTPTNQNVTVSATFSDDSAVKEFSLDGKDWTAYSDGVTVTDNGTVYFRGTDEAGNVSDVASFLVSNIDKVAPEKPSASASVTAPTRTNVLVTATFSDDSAIREYSMNGESWHVYTKSINFTDNGTVYFRGTDEAGNISETTVYTVDNIITAPLDAPVISVDVTDPTHGTVSVSASFSEISAVNQYSVDGLTWLDYDGPLTFADNGFVVFLCIDASGECAYSAYAVTNIDRIAPEKPGAYADATAPTNRDVTVKAMFSNDTTKKEYSSDGENWLTYKDGIVFEENGTVYFRGTDAAGNVSDVTMYEVTNIDKIAPKSPTVSANITTVTNKDVLVTAEFSDDSVVKEYSLDGETWLDYTEAIDFSENGVSYFRGRDEAGNFSSIADYAVVIIDKEPPVAPVASADITTPTNQDVTVTAVFSDDSATREYSMDEQTWKEYTEPIVFSENGTVYFRGIDAAGNISDITVYEVTNIDKSGPIEDKLLFFNGDFNGAGKAMLAVQEQNGNTVTIYTDGASWGTGLVLDPGWEIAGIGDFNGDGADDFLRVHSSGLVIGEMSDGNGAFAPQVLNFLNEGWSILGTGDFNGNGTDDVLIANPTAASETVGLLGYWESGTTWTLINGYSAEWEMVATGDFNADGKCDMLWRNEFVGEGDLVYNAFCTWIVEDPVDWRMVSVANPAEWNFLCAGDFDGDKMNDIAMINDVGVVGIWGVNDGWLSSWSILSAVTSEWQLAGVADFNGDGTDDIAWANSDTGLVGCWQIENKELASWQTIVNLA